MKELMQKLLEGIHFSQRESYDLFSKLEQVSHEQQAAILTLLRVNRESPQALLGARNFLLKNSTVIECPFKIIDIVGTGGDGIGTFNISTAASLVIASCGVYVAKHGGRSASSKSGSMDVMESLGLQPMHSVEHIIECLRTDCYAYLWAPLFNNVLKQFGDLRKALGFPTIFNILGPLLNPMKPKHQVIGVYRKDLVKTVAEVLRASGSIHSLVVHSEDGLDEFSVSAASYVAELKDGKISEYTVHPSDVGLPLSNLTDVIGGTPQENAQIIVSILSGKMQGPKSDIVLLNSAAGLLVSGTVENLREGIEVARNAITSGRTIDLLNKLKNKDIG